MTSGTSKLAYALIISLPIIIASFFLLIKLVFIDNNSNEIDQPVLGISEDLPADNTGSEDVQR